MSSENKTPPPRAPHEKAKITLTADFWDLVAGYSLSEKWVLVALYLFARPDQNGKLYCFPTQARIQYLLADISVDTIQRAITRFREDQVITEVISVKPNGRRKGRPINLYRLADLGTIGLEKLLLPKGLDVSKTQETDKFFDLVQSELEEGSRTSGQQGQAATAGQNNGRRGAGAAAGAQKKGSWRDKPRDEMTQAELLALYIGCEPDQIDEADDE